MISIRAALAGCVVALTVVGAFMALDRIYLHWYAEEAPSTSALEGRIAALEVAAGDNSSKDADTAAVVTKISEEFYPLRNAVVAELHCSINNPPPGGGPPISCP